MWIINYNLHSILTNKKNNNIFIEKEEEVEEKHIATTSTIQNYNINSSP